MLTPRMVLLTCVILLAAVTRFVPHPQNVTPIVAMTLFAAAQLPSRRLSFGLPLAVMLISDAVLYATKDAVYRDYALGTMLWVYPTLILITLLGRWLNGRVRPMRVAGCVLSGSVVFFLVTNFGFWLTQTGFYAHTPSGLWDCYVAGLPFFRNAILGDAAFGVLFFGGFAWLERSVPQVCMRPLESQG